MSAGRYLATDGLAPEVGSDLRPREAVSLEAASPDYARNPRDKVGLSPLAKPNDFVTAYAASSFAARGAK